MQNAGVVEIAGTERLSVEARTDLVSRFLVEEIAEIESAARRPGWTTWVLCAAFASLVWSFFGLVETGGIRWTNVCVLFVGLSIARDSVYLLGRMLVHTEPGYGNRVRLEAVRVSLAPRRLRMTAVVLSQAVLLWILYRGALGLPHYVLWPARLFCWVETAVTGLSLVASYVSFATPRRALGATGSTLVLAFVGLGIASVALLSRYLVTNHRLPPIPDWRVALVLVVGTALVALLSGSHCQPVGAEQLRDVHRRLCLGDIDVSVAVRETDLILYGLTVDAALQPHLAGVISAFSDEREAWKEVRRTLQALRSVLPSEPCADPQCTNTTMRSLSDSLGKATAKANATSAATSRALSQFGSYSKILFQIVPAAAQETECLLLRLENENALLFEEFRGLHEDCDMIRSEMSRVEEVCSACRNKSGPGDPGEPATA